MTIGGYFEHYMYHVIGCMAEERKKEEDEQFLLSTVSGCYFKIVAITAADRGRLYKLLN